MKVRCPHLPPHPLTKTLQNLPKTETAPHLLKGKTMPISQKQLEANRKNAQKSTGPKTAEGKAIVSQNAVKDGLTANSTILNSPLHSENKVEYENLLNSLNDELTPKTELQKILVKRIADCIWRSNRLIRVETANINRQLCDIENEFMFEKLQAEYQDYTDEEKETDLKYQQQLTDIIGLNLIPRELYSKRLLKYEIRFERQLSKTYKLLKMLQIQTHFDSLQNRYKKTENDNTNPFDNIEDSEIVILK